MSRIEEAKRGKQELRQEAIDLINGLLHYPKDVVNPKCERLVDCVICASTLENVIIQNQAFKDTNNV